MLRTHLQAQNCMALPASIVGFACVANAALDAALVHSLGFVGAAHATTLCRVMQALLLACACVWAQWRTLRRGRIPLRAWTPVAWSALKTACNPQVPP
jgi:Na+-driven multidrug efflux pump